MILQIGARVIYAGIEWEVYDCKTDEQKIIMIVLIDPDYNAESGQPEPTIYVRDLSGITPINKAA
jgi:hypothetical protein